MYDLVIIGSGPAGMSAAVYAKRAMLKVLMIEKAVISGGQIINTNEVDNYLGFYGINGFELAMKFREHVDRFEIDVLNETVKNIKHLDEYNEILLEGEKVIQTKTIIIATGAKYRLLGVPGEKEFRGKGVSFCATCDGAFFRKKTVAVVGGGDVAVEDAIYLSNICEKVYLINRRKELRAAKSLQDKMNSIENIEFIFDSVVEEISGNEVVENIKLKNVRNSMQQNINVSGVFIAIGMIPENEIIRNVLALDENGYIIAGEDGITNIESIFAAGDIRTKPLRQIITAVSDGAMAVNSAEKYLN